MDFPHPNPYNLQRFITDSIRFVFEDILHCLTNKVKKEFHLIYISFEGIYYPWIQIQKDLGFFRHIERRNLIIVLALGSISIVKLKKIQYLRTKETLDIFVRIFVPFFFVS